MTLSVVGRAAAIAMLWSGFAGCASEDAGSAQSRCIALRDHLVELRLKTTSVDVDSHRKAIRDALGPSFVESCREMGAEYIKCAMAANDVRSAVACSSRK